MSWEFATLGAYGLSLLRDCSELNQLSAHISELTDHVAKARLRETELTERVARWVEYLREEKEKMLKRGNSLYATGTLSAIVSDDIEYNISMLMKMRERVDKKLLEIKQRRKEHKYQLKEMKNEMLLMHHQLVEWDKKYDEISDITKRMNVSRKQLQDRIKEQQQKETAAKVSQFFFIKTTKIQELLVEL
ncbi:unnamed protein product [Haemonchus placei]|uniref:Uncharacterized protein n=1 Tax=Haemonchus placei TaxID=6290 RepID=A0A0N4WMF5_HAEPC|nr:unnamed protein product [Haemonchus placei]